MGARSSISPALMYLFGRRAMGGSKVLCRLGSVNLIAALMFLALMSGCQVGPSVATNQLIAHQVFVDFTGLAPSHNVRMLKIQIAPPRDWEAIRTKASPLYSHLQWRSPSHVNAVGVVYAKLPIPFSAKTIAWLAEREYAQQANDGRVLGQWTDSLNRCWFEAENKFYHVRGYVIAHDGDAWIVYCGYKLASPPMPKEMSLAARSMETIVPLDDHENVGESAQASAR